MTATTTHPGYLPVAGAGDAPPQLAPKAKVSNGWLMTEDGIILAERSIHDTAADAKVTMDRLAACWNFCRGMDTATLKALSDPSHSHAEVDPRVLREAKAIAQRVQTEEGRSAAWESIDPWLQRHYISKAERQLGWGEVETMTPSVPDASEHPITLAVRDVLIERRRQYEVHSFSRDGDADGEYFGEIAQAGASYLLWPSPQKSTALTVWPWESASWKASSERRALVKGVALGLAALEAYDSRRQTAAETAAG